MADQTGTSTREELHRAIHDMERELSRELRRLCAQLRDAKDAASSITEPL